MSALLIGGPIVAALFAALWANSWERKHANDKPNPPTDTW